MSEYQYYEFLAIDRPLSKKEMDAIGEFSTRADISPTRFANEYHWGNFRGSPEKFLQNWYDLMLYFANWGTRRFMCRIPLDLINVDYAKKCCASDSASLKIVNRDAAVLDFTSDAEDGVWMENGEGSSFMASLAPIRAELLAGDNRPLYLAWLLGIQFCELDEVKIEPAVPPGLKKLSAAQKAFADFFRIDNDLLTTAAANSPPLEEAPEGFEDWLREIPIAEKDALLLSLIHGTDPHAGGRLRRRFASSQPVASRRNADAPRSVGQLLAAARALTVQREAHERELAAKARAKMEAAEKAARTAYLDTLSAREEQTWGKIDFLIATKSPKSYDESVKLLRDLHDLADRRGSISKFAANLQSIVIRNIKKPSLIQRIQKNGLISATGKSG